MANWDMDADSSIDAMSLRSAANWSGWIGRVLPPLVLTLAAGCFVPVHAATEGQLDVDEAPKHHASRHIAGQGLDDRVRLLSKALDLDASQQTELRKVLEGQREKVSRLWSDSSLPATYRISAMQAISDQTAEQIRVLLNEEQRKKYNAPRQRHAAEGSARPDVEAWMNAAKSK